MFAPRDQRPPHSLNGFFLLRWCAEQDTKPHRSIPLAQLLDALEYDLPPHRHTPASPPVSPPHHPAHGADEHDGGAGKHTFKIVTTKRTLLLCAPSEEEEIKWLSAIRALIARRSGQGVVPGEPSSFSSVSPPGGAHAHTHVGAPPGAGTGTGTGGGVESPAGAASGKRRDSFVRRLSLSGRGGTSPFAGAGAGAGGGGGSSSATSPPGAATSLQEAPSERQS